MEMKIQNKGILTSFYNVNERKTKTDVQISFSEVVGKRKTKVEVQNPF